MRGMEITVRSEATGRRQPELSTLWATASAEGTDRAAARQQVTAVMQELVDSLDELGASRPDAVRSRVVAPLATRTWQPWGDDGKRLDPRHEVTGRVRVQLADLEALADLTTAWSARDEVALQSPTWSLTDDSQRALHAEVTRDAVRQARERAEVMAEASGFSMVEPLQVADTGLLGGGDDQRVGQVQAFSAAGAGAADDGYDLTPQDVEVRVTVEARFRAE